MIFELGKMYVHTTGRTIRIVGKLTEDGIYGSNALVAEDVETGELISVGIGEDFTVNYKEVR